MARLSIASVRARVPRRIGRWFCSAAGGGDHAGTAGPSVRLGASCRTCQGTACGWRRASSHARTVSSGTSGWNMGRTPALERGARGSDRGLRTRGGTRGRAVRKPAAALRTPRRARTGVGGGHVEARDDHARPSPPRRPVRAPPSVRRASRVVRTARRVRARRSRTAPRRPRARTVTGDIASQQSRDCMPTEVSDATWCYRSWVTCFRACGIGAPREGVRGSCRGRPRGGDAAGENDNGPGGVPPGPTRIG